MAKGSYFLVYGTRDVTVEAAEAALSRSKMLAVARDGDALTVRRKKPGGPELVVGVNAEPWVAVEAAEAAERHAVAAIAGCGRRFEVAFDDLEEVLDECNTLFEVQCGLADLTGGYVINAWNGLLVPS